MGTDLKGFCAAEDAERYALHEPWVSGGWRYATDGRIIVRVPAPDEPDTVAERLVQGPGAWFFGGGKYMLSRCTAPFPAHDGKTERRRCSEDHQPDCFCCQGEGTCECSDCGHEHGCLECKGTGRNPEYKPLPDCECGGTGVRLIPAPMELSGKRIAGKYVILISGLPNARYDPDGASNHLLCFQADEGIEGMVGVIRVTTY